MTGQSSPERTGAVSQRPFARVVLPLLVIELFATIETSMAFVAVPAFMHDFGVDAVAAGWTATAYLLVGAAAGAISGRLGDIFGRRRVLIAVLAIGLLGSLVSFLAPALWVLILGRGLQGLAAAALPLCFGLLRQLLEPARVALGMSLVIGVVSISAGVGSLIAGTLIDAGGWRPIFLAASAVGIFAMLMTLITVPNTPGMLHRPRIDVLGGVLLAPGCAGILLGASFARVWGWIDPRVIGAFGLGIAAFAVWLWWESRVPDPMVQLRLFRDRKIVLTTLAAVAVGIGLMGPTSLLVPIVLQLPANAPVGLGLSASFAGLLMLVNAFLGYGASAVAGLIAQRHGARWSLMIAFVLIIAAGLLWLAVAKSVPWTVVVICLTSMSSAMALTALPTLVVEVVPEANTGEATGVNRLAMNISIAVGVSVSSMLLASSSAPGTTLPSFGGFTTVLTVVIAIGAVGLALALSIGPGRVRATPQISSVAAR
jgi:MFS family permease